MATIRQIQEFLQEFAPLSLAEEWDNVGLLVGDSSASAQRVMTCLTVTPESVAEAIGQQVDLIISHHPLPFRPLRRITSESVAGRLLLDLIAARVAVISPHTAFDSAPRGINQRLAEGLGLQGVAPLVDADENADGAGTGRCGRLSPAASLETVAAGLKTFLSIDRLRYVGRLEQMIERVAVACGSGGEFVAAAIERGCDLLVTGETNFHGCLEAQAGGLCLLLPGHFASERFAVEELAGVVQRQFSQLEVWACRTECDPLGSL